MLPPSMSKLKNRCSLEVRLISSLSLSLALSLQLLSQGGAARRVCYVEDVGPAVEISEDREGAGDQLFGDGRRRDGARAGRRPSPLEVNP
jgi:hypothetical protein